MILVKYYKIDLIVTKWFYCAFNNDKTWGKYAQRYFNVCFFISIILFFLYTKHKPVTRSFLKKL